MPSHVSTSRESWRPMLRYRQSGAARGVPCKGGGRRSLGDLSTKTPNQRSLYAVNHLLVQCFLAAVLLSGAMGTSFTMGWAAHEESQCNPLEACAGNITWASMEITWNAEYLPTTRVVQRKSTKYQAIKPRSYKNTTGNRGNYTVQQDYFMSSNFTAQITTLLRKTSRK